MRLARLHVPRWARRGGFKRGPQCMCRCARDKRTHTLPTSPLASRPGPASWWACCTPSRTTRCLASLLACWRFARRGVLAHSQNDSCFLRYFQPSCSRPMLVRASKRDCSTHPSPRSHGWALDITARFAHSASPCCGRGFSRVSFCSREAALAQRFVSGLLVDTRPFADLGPYAPCQRHKGTQNRILHSICAWTSRQCHVPHDYAQRTSAFLCCCKC
jgi:hypothetical protein